MSKSRKVFGLAVTIILTVALSISSVKAAAKPKEFYLRYIGPEQIAVMDNEAKKKGSKYYFDLLQSKDMYDQYMAINKLVEYYNKDDIRKRAITAIKPFLKSNQPELKKAASFSLDILQKTFKSKSIVHLANGQKLFTLFNNYSDYGSFNEILSIKNDKISVYWTFQRPQMYITNMTASPDKKMVAITMSSNKSNYLVVGNSKGVVSPELVESARISIAKDMNYELPVRIDYENYSGVEDIMWLDNNTLIFTGHITYNGAEIVMNPARINYNCKTRELECFLAVN